MITWMQHNKKYLIATIWVSVIALVGAGFVGFGSVDFSGRANSIAKVGNHDISVSSYQNTYQRYFDYFNSLNNGQLTQEIADKQGLRGIVIQALTNEALLFNFADEIGFVALEEDVIDLLVNDPSFHDKNGNFNHDIYDATLKNNRLRKNEYEKSLERVAIMNKVNSIFSMLPATQIEKEVFGAALYVEDRVSIATISVKESEVTVSNDEILTYWENNKNRFLTEKEYKFESIFVPVSKEELKEEDIRTHYEETKYFYKDDDDRIFDYDTVKSKIKNDLSLKHTENDALKIYLDFKNGAIQPQKIVTIKETSSEYDTTEFQTHSVGDVLKPIKKSDGYEILKLTDISFPAPKSYDEAKDEVKKILVLTKKAQLLNSKAQERAESFEGKDIGYISQNTTSIDNLNSLEVLQLVKKVFSSNNKYGYVVFEDKAILYKITDQRLPNADAINNNKQFVEQIIEQVKTNEIKNDVIKELKNRYKITQYIQG